MINAGKYNRPIDIVEVTIGKDAQGFKVTEDKKILSTYASVKTTKGMTLIKANTDFEKAFTNFTIRYPVTPINRDMVILFNGKRYTIQYLNNINEANVELEIQAREITH